MDRSDTRALAFLRRTTQPCPLPPGTRIRVTAPLRDEPNSPAVGTEGTVFGGNGGQLWVSWPDGARLALLVDEDPYEVSAPETGELRRVVMETISELQDLDVHQSPAGHVVIGLIRVRREHRRRGFAERTMRMLTAWSDFHGLTLATTPYPLETERPYTKVGPLKLWCASHGFLRNQGRKRRDEITDRMYRSPKEYQP